MKHAKKKIYRGKRTVQNKTQRKIEWNKNKESINSFWDNNKPSIRIIEVPERQGWQKIKIIITEKIPNVIKTINPQIQEAH